MIRLLKSSLKETDICLMIEFPAVGDNIEADAKNR